ncbi:type 4a pilus biogenesis protein PilO [Romboutsia sp.]|uniref:type 4a pilus biogenesis protein PilO n=1 Tax=Romboutsia sp. TaxID=1965302 RepID=UPI002C524C35|nr:type 4a pilus biogenesis protein PilO [Romboutsia sp.]HSQ88643.1 type 4a pilus biogenesis protein PilO [Romboutsia sp.]
MSKDKNNIDEVKEKKNISQMDVNNLFKRDILKQNISPKSAAIIIGVLVGIAVYGYLFVYPKFMEYKTTKSNLENVQSELLEYQQKLDKIPMLQERLDALTKEAKIKSKRLSHDMEDGLFLIGLDKVIRDLGIRLINYTIEDSVDYDNFYAIPMSLSVEGDYRRVRELIYYLENQKNITQVMNYSMATKMTETKKEINKRVYWTRGDTYYHLDKSCPSMVKGDILYGTPAQSGARKPDPDCVEDISNTIEVQVTSKASGDVSANIKFIVYSSEKDIIKLDTDKPENWKSGKYNPFEDTLN